MEEQTTYQLDPNYVGPPSEFERALTTLINKHSIEGRSETPDFVLAKYLEGCLVNFAVAVLRRDQWYHFNQKKDFNLLDETLQQNCKSISMEDKNQTDAVDFLKWALANNFLLGDSDGHECVLLVDNETEESLYERYLDSKNK